jgi:3-oxoacyl-[acyl-carrier-protein] synthase-3
MSGPEVFRFATRVVVEATHEVLRSAGLQVCDVDLFVPHQANTRIIGSAVRRLGIPPDRVFVNIDRYGNTSSASIPIALCEAEAQGRLHPGDTVVMVGFGAGLTWGAGAVQWAAHSVAARRRAGAEAAAVPAE